MDLPIEPKLEGSSTSIDIHEENQNCFSLQQESKAMPLSDIVKKRTVITSQEDGYLVGLGNNSYNCLVSCRIKMIIFLC